ncbi:MAG: glycosyltransferase family 2 protein [Salinarimonadaceae bacterium]|nr:MAG: glycosyltransferase family 2 protein [Salinarimonadaceae bacterium]
MMQNGESGSAPRLSVIVPVKNEAQNIMPLIAEIEAACAPGGAFEIIYVDDGSTDDTPVILARAAAEKPHLRAFRHARSCGQSAAVRTGVENARAAICCTLDGDGQNDPVFIPQLVAALDAGGESVGLAAGQRTGRHGLRKRLQSRLANKVRGAILKDGTRDSGCGLKAFRRADYLRLPYFDALHRFMPALIRREGLGIVHVDVVDRPRFAGVSNYGLFDRLWVGIMDLAGVWWLIRRRRSKPQVTEVTGP